MTKNVLALHLLCTAVRVNSAFYDDDDDDLGLMAPQL